MKVHEAVREVHEAGTPTDEGCAVVQRCRRCDAELSRYDRDNPPQGVVEADGSVAPFPMWTEGVHVEVAGNGMWITRDRVTCVDN